jgi:prepilin-type N-terminal cleavage/methylation domain-containing protein
MRWRGLSLFEVLVVMVIITILVAIFVPAVWHFVQYVRHLGDM